MSQGPAAQLLRHVASAPKKRDLWRRALAALPAQATGETVELAAADACHRSMGLGAAEAFARKSRPEQKGTVVGPYVRVTGPKETPLPTMLKEQLQSADAVRLVHAVKAYAMLRVRDRAVLETLQRRSSELATSWQLKGRPLAELADHLGKLASRGEAFGQRLKSGREHRHGGGLAWKTLAQQLGERLVGSGHQLRLIDLAVGLGGLARLGTAAEVVLPPLQQHVLAALRGKESEFARSDVRSEVDPRHVGTLVASYSAFARLKHRDDVILDAAGAVLEIWVDTTNQ
ncbi:unnamed protein product [Cladocopium goreaui]|uniref:YrhK domain-containing protein n=1 Tax=Cladocopium goreaui TaxID=2562237 RepID=A0A9P1BZX3_9DINO|nr:unnamed protein product [Cladocopium goreaui]